MGVDGGGMGWRSGSGLVGMACLGRELVSRGMGK